MIVLRQFAFGVQPDFVQHPAKMEKAAYFFRGAAEFWHVHDLKSSAFAAGVSRRRDYAHIGRRVTPLRAALFEFGAQPPYGVQRNARLTEYLK